MAQSEMMLSCSAFKLGYLNRPKATGNRQQATGNTQFKCILAYLKVNHFLLSFFPTAQVPNVNNPNTVDVSGTGILDSLDSIKLKYAFWLLGLNKESPDLWKRLKP